MKATFTFTPGDILLELNNTPLILMEKPDQSKFDYGVVKQGQIDLSVEQAEDLVQNLQECIKNHYKFKEQYNKYMENNHDKR